MRAHYAVLSLLSLLSPRHPEGADPDVKLAGIIVRDRERFELIAPTAGRDITVYVEVSNGYEPAPDMNLTCRRSAFAGGPTLATGTVRTGAFSPYSRRRIKVAVSGSSTAGAASMWCMVDAGNFVRESDENDNALTIDFVIHNDIATDFRVELKNLKAPNSYYHTVDFEVFNPTTRGPEVDLNLDDPRELRWQAKCTITEMPWVVVRASRYSNKFPSGWIPGPGKTITSQFFLFNWNQEGKPRASSFPPPLNLVCTLTVGVFTPNVPVMHPGESAPSPDWGFPMVWFAQPAVLRLPNPS